MPIFQISISQKAIRFLKNQSLIPSLYGPDHWKMRLVLMVNFARVITSLGPLVQYKCEICNRKLTRTNDFEIYHTNKLFGEKLQTKHKSTSNFRRAISTLIRMKTPMTLKYVMCLQPFCSGLRYEFMQLLEETEISHKKFLGKCWHTFGIQMVYYCYELISRIF